MVDSYGCLCGVSASKQILYNSEFVMILEDGNEYSDDDVVYALVNIAKKEIQTLWGKSDPFKELIIGNIDSNGSPTIWRSEWDQALVGGHVVDFTDFNKAEGHTNSYSSTRQTKGVLYDA